MQSNVQALDHVAYNPRIDKKPELRKSYSLHDAAGLHFMGG